MSMRPVYDQYSHFATGLIPEAIINFGHVGGIIFGFVKLLVILTFMSAIHLNYFFKKQQTHMTIPKGDKFSSLCFGHIQRWQFIDLRGHEFNDWFDHQNRYNFHRWKIAYFNTTWQKVSDNDRM